jgi:YD repeat-containing protein
VITETGFDGLTRKYQRNKAGQVEKLLRSDGKATAYEYDACGRVIEVRYSDGKREQYAYDLAGRLIKAANEQAEVLIERDILGRVIKESSNGQWVESHFDEGGNRSRITSSLGADIAQGFDPWGNTISRQSKGWQSQIQRDQFGQEEERHLPGGISSRWRRNQRGDVLSHRVSQSHTIHGPERYTQYEWDVDSRLKALTDPVGGEIRFEHDRIGNLTKTIFGDGKEQLRNPDKVGNLFESLDQKDRKYDKGGKLLESKGTAYKYDGEGNLIEKKSKEGQWRYEWNSAGMLSKVTRPDQLTVTFGYDAWAEGYGSDTGVRSPSGYGMATSLCTSGSSTP